MGRYGELSEMKGLAEYVKTFWPILSLVLICVFSSGGVLVKVDANEREMTSLKIDLGKNMDEDRKDRESIIEMRGDIKRVLYILEQK